MNIKIRPATKNDRLKIASFIIEASEGICEYLFDNCPTGIDIFKILSLEITNIKSPISYQNCLIADYNGVAVGGVILYSSEFIMFPNYFFIPQEKIEFMKKFCELKFQQSLYIDTISVDRQFRNHGIGVLLLERSISHAKEMNFKRMSLFVWGNNIPAIKLYQRFGFREDRVIYTKKPPDLSKTVGRILMYLDL